MTTSEGRRMRKRAWAWTKFVALMLCLGVFPFSLDVPAPLILALVAVAMVAATAIAVRHARVVFGAVAALFYAAFPALAPLRDERFTLPEAPGTRGTIRSRAPSLLNAALE